MSFHALTRILVELNITLVDFHSISSIRYAFTLAELAKKSLHGSKDDADTPKYINATFPAVQEHAPMFLEALAEAKKAVGEIIRADLGPGAVANGWCVCATYRIGLLARPQT